jgi:hypothetical protein
VFLSYDYQKGLGYDEKTKQYRYQYKLIDSDFEEVVATRDPYTQLSAIGEIIDVYEKRNLNVAANLIKAFIFLEKKYNWPIKYAIASNKKYNQKYVKYEKDMEKYLILL